MRALVVFESMYGNTHVIASNIADGLRASHEVTVVPVAGATPELLATADLLVVGGPTHMHGMSNAASRQMAAETARKEGSGLTMDPDAGGPGIREWLNGIGDRHGPAAAFDTRINGVPAFTGRASRGIARAAQAARLRAAHRPGELPYRQAQHPARRRGHASPQLGQRARHRREQRLRLHARLSRMPSETARMF